MTEDDFIAAVCADPFDDGVRLAYSDWLEEHGRIDYACFIRLQIQIVAEFGVPSDGGVVVTGDKRVDAMEVAMRQRERELLETRDVCLEASRVACVCGFTGRFGTDHGFAGGVNHRWSFRRGFVESLTCHLEDFIGSNECEACAGYGGLEEGTGQWWQCTNCEGTGRNGGHGVDIVKATPLLEVTFTDLEPSNTRRRSGGRTRHWSWFREDAFLEGRMVTGNRDTGWLPPCFSPEDNRRRWNFSTVEKANSWLSARAIAWARDKAGLPALDQKRLVIS